MKANELMIGDWVMFQHGIDKIIDLPYICGKGLCASFSASATLFSISIEQLKPIPLTPKILEKNGFKKTSDGWECDESDVLTIAIHDGISCDMWIAEAPYDFKHLAYTLPFPRSAHELQHAFRICGIDKDITL